MMIVAVIIGIATVIDASMMRMAVVVAAIVLVGAALGLERARRRASPCSPGRAPSRRARGRPRSRSRRPPISAGVCRLPMCQATRISRSGFSALISRSACGAALTCDEPPVLELARRRRRQAPPPCRGRAGSRARPRLSAPRGGGGGPHGRGSTVSATRSGFTAALRTTAVARSMSNPLRTGNTAAPSVAPSRVRRPEARRRR